MQRVNEEGGQTFLKKKPEDVVAVVSGSLKPYFYVVRSIREHRGRFSVLL